MTMKVGNHKGLNMSIKAFADLLDSLIFTPSRNGKIRLLQHYFAHQTSPDRGWGLAAVTGNVDFPNVKSSLIRKSIEPRVDMKLFDYSYDYVGDLAETVSLMWPENITKKQKITGKQKRASSKDRLSLSNIISELHQVKRKDAQTLLEDKLDLLDAQQRYALLKLITGGLRVGVSERLAKQALAQMSNIDINEIEEVWHGLTPPYDNLFEWLDGERDKPSLDNIPYFRPLMLAVPLENSDIQKLNPRDFLAEWKWDGIRVQIVGLKTSHDTHEARIYSRSGDDISKTFPDIIEHINFEGVFDGELLVMRDGEVQSFNDLQQRLNRKTVTKKMLQNSPAFVRLYDVLEFNGQDTRLFPTSQRRQILYDFIDSLSKDSRFDLSPDVEFKNWDDLNHKRETIAELKGHIHVEGVMVKHKNSPYLSGRPKGHWFKWKRTPPTIDCVLMYAQRGHGKRSSYYSDYTFGCWRDNSDGVLELVPVGKAYFGFTDEELKQIDKWVRNNTIDRFGPVREVKKQLVFEVAFDSVHHSTRHKSGVAMRFPRISRIRWDKPAEQADILDQLLKLIRA